MDNQPHVDNYHEKESVIYEIKLASYIDHIKELDTLQVLVNQAGPVWLVVVKNFYKGGCLTSTRHRLPMITHQSDLTLPLPNHRALTESEDKKKSMRSQIVQLEQEVKKLKEEKLTLHKILHDQQVAKTTAETSGPSSNMKRRAPEDSPNESHKTMRMQQPEIHNVEDIENSFVS
ncbi:hypothetical protein ACJJTC_002520 [Scirpophaga incertulas]